MKKLRRALEEYLQIRRALGFKLPQAAGLLRQFVAFADHEGSSFVSKKLALKWATQPPNVLRSTWAERLRLVRCFAKYLSASDPRTEIPQKDLLPYRYQRKPPYFYTDKEILTLIHAAKKLGPPGGLRVHTYSTLFGLLAATGMRISEPIGLDRSDVDLQQGLLTIRQAKFGKSRLVPLHASTVRKLREYARLRDRLLPNPMSPSFFVSDRGTRLTGSAVHRRFVILSRQIGLRGATDSHGPRLHDLRHRFVIKTLVKWYHSGVDVERRMPILTTYLGHGHVADTYWYISATPQLLRLATLRLEKSQRRPLP